MADADSITTDSSVVSGCFRLPRIQIPNDIEEISESARGDFYFEIRTHKGTIKATSYWGERWECLGTVDALEAAALLRPEWCPGLAGNNKTRQTVVFKDGMAWLIYGNRAGSNLKYPHIVIKRASANKFCVEVMVSKGQKEWLSPAVERRKQRAATKLQQKNQIEKRHDKEEQYSKFYSSPSLFKDESIHFLKNIFNFSMERLSGKYEFSEYGEATIWIDEQSMQDVLFAGARLFEAVRAAKVVCRRKAPHLSVVAARKTETFTA